jgi:acetylornithine/succinyldiaminopimelate/putrescine aminotransferase
LIGVNVVGHEHKKLKEVMQKEQVTWRSISSQAVTSRWNAATPTYYVIDVKGVIRNKWVGNPGEKAIEMALEKLIHQAEGDTKK